MRAEDLSARFKEEFSSIREEEDHMALNMVPISEEDEMKRRRNLKRRRKSFATIRRQRSDLSLWKPAHSLGCSIFCYVALVSYLFLMVHIGKTITRDYIWVMQKEAQKPKYQLIVERVVPV